MKIPKKLWIGGFALIEGLAIFFLLKSWTEPRRPVTVLERNLPGMGDSHIELEAFTSQGRFPVRFDLGERVYTEEELEHIFDQGKAWLDTIWLGANESPLWVEKDLRFPNRVDGLDLAVKWIPKENRWIQSDGKIREEARTAAPVETSVRAVLVYGNEERGYEYTFTIQKSVLEGEAAWRQSIEDSILKAETDSRQSAQFVLPKEVGDEALSWYELKTDAGTEIFLFMNLIFLLLYFCHRDRKRQKEKEREWELAQDYPDIVYRLILLISSGMTVRAAWEKVVVDYQRWNKRTGKCRQGYQEMEKGLNEMNVGIAELKAYENFGNRCGSPNYVRLATLLIQQVRRGARGMQELLSREVAEAEIIRRENGRKAAEAAAGRLVLPMILLMVVVFAVLMIPAFLSMNF